MKYINRILDSKKTVFNYNDLSLLLGISNKNTLKSFLQRGMQEGIFICFQKGLYGLKSYNSYELATKLKKISYISFETVLKSEGIIFQDYGDTLFLASNNTIEKEFGDVHYRYLKIKDSILLNPAGIIQKGNYMIASTERAICDRIYLSKNYYFDNLDSINWEYAESLAQMYNKRVILEIQKLKKYATQ